MTMWVQARSRREVVLALNLQGPGEIKREVVMDPVVSPAEIMSREVELGCESWTFFASSCYSTVVQQTLSLWLCLAQQLKQQLRNTLVAVQWRQDTVVFRVGVHGQAFTPPPALISNLGSVDVKPNVNG